MRICDLEPDQIKLGMRVKSASSSKLGIIAEFEQSRNFWWIKWDGEDECTSGFFFNQSKAVVVE